MTCIPLIVDKNNFNGPPLKQMRLCPSDSIISQSTGASTSDRTFHSSDHSQHVLTGRRRPTSQAAPCPRQGIHNMLVCLFVCVQCLVVCMFSRIFVTLLNISQCLSMFILTIHSSYYSVLVIATCLL